MPGSIHSFQKRHDVPPEEVYDENLVLAGFEELDLDSLTYYPRPEDALVFANIQDPETYATMKEGDEPLPLDQKVLKAKQKNSHKTRLQVAKAIRPGVVKAQKNAEPNEIIKIGEETLAEAQVIINGEPLQAKHIHQAEIEVTKAGREHIEDIVDGVYSYDPAEEAQLLFDNDQVQRLHSI